VLAIAFLINPTEHSNGSLSLSQTGLTERIIEALGLHSLYSTKKDNPAKTTPLTKDANGIPADPIIHNPSVIGMLLHLAGHSRLRLLLRSKLIHRTHETFCECIRTKFAVHLLAPNT
jgi:hypothetical protein